MFMKVLLASMLGIEEKYKKLVLLALVYEDDVFLL